MKPSYDMFHKRRGIAVVISNENFDILSMRKGTDVDARVLDDVLKRLGFETKILTDRKRDDMLTDLNEGMHIFSILSQVVSKCILLTYMYIVGAQVMFRDFVFVVPTTASARPSHTYIFLQIMCAHNIFTDALFFV